MRRMLAMVIASAAIAGCEATQAEAAATPRTTPSANQAASAADAASAEAFLRGVFASYAADYSGEEVSVYSARALARMEASGNFDADPFCACQDWDGLAVRSIRTAPGPNGSIDAAATFVNFGEAMTQTYRLVREAGEWRVDDILFDGRSTL